MINRTDSEQRCRLSKHFKLIAGATLLMAAGAANAATLAVFEFTGGATGGSNVVTGMTATSSNADLTNVQGVDLQSGSGVFNAPADTFAILHNDLGTSATTSTDYLQFVLDPDPGMLNLTDVTFDITGFNQSTNDGSITTTVSLRGSVDNFATNTDFGTQTFLFTAGNTNQTFSFTESPFVTPLSSAAPGAAITFRMFFWVSNNSTTVGGQDADRRGVAIDNVTFNGTLVPLPPAVWLLGSSLIGLMGISRRKSQPRA